MYFLGMDNKMRRVYDNNKDDFPNVIEFSKHVNDFMISRNYSGTIILHKMNIDEKINFCMKSRENNSRNIYTTPFIKDNAFIKIRRSFFFITSLFIVILPALYLTIKAKNDFNDFDIKDNLDFIGYIGENPLKDDGKLISVEKMISLKRRETEMFIMFFVILACNIFVGLIILIQYKKMFVLGKLRNEHKRKTNKE
jgi:hypothetical protein